MSTNAVIFCKNTDGTFNGISVHFDGYVKNGVGEQLFDYWNNVENVQKLCAMKKQIRSFGNSFDDIEFFDDNTNPICRKQIKALKNLTFDQMNNECSQYNYAYLHDNDEDYKWLIYNGYGSFTPISL